MSFSFPTRPELKRLVVTARWAIRLMFSINRKLTIGLALATLARGIVPAGLALFARGIINAFVANPTGTPITLEHVMPWVLFGFGVTLLEAIAPLATNFCTERLHDDINVTLTSAILAHAEKLDPAFFEDPEKRNLIDRAEHNPADPIVRFISEADMALMTLIQAVLLATILISIEPLIAFAMTPFALPYLLFHWNLSKAKYEEQYQRTPRRRWTIYFVSLMTGRPSLPEVRLLNLSPLLRDRFRTLMSDFREHDGRLYRRNFVGSSLFATVTTAAFYLVFARVIGNVIRGALTVGDVAVFGGATARLRFSLEFAIRSFSASLEQTFYICNLIEFFAERPNMTSARGVLPSAARGDIHLKNVFFTYPGSDTPALNDISLHIHAGETVAIVGENGAGKTTLVKLLARLYDPDRGAIELDGVDLRTLSPVDLHKHVGFVFQEFNHYEATARDNIAYGNWQELMTSRSERVQEIARLAGIDQMIESLPKKYDTTLGRTFGQHDLSKGQWQKLAIARAFARDAAILILDEPASSLSAQAEYDLFCHFRELSRGRTTVLISHRFSTLTIADRILVMENGRIIESGSHRDLIANAGSYARLYRLHRQPFKSPELRTPSEPGR